MSEAERPYFAMPWPGIFRLTCMTPFPGLPHVHVYMAEGPGGGLVIIDTAMPYADSLDRIMQGIEWMGRRPGDVEAIYLTHAHPDHFGCAGLLQEATGAPVICHPNAKRALEAMRNPDMNRWQRLAGVYSEHGRQSDQMIEGRAQGAFAAMLFPTEIQTVDEGETVSFAAGEWHITWTPGHEEGHVVFHRPEDKVAIVGDTVLGKITPHIGWMVEPPDPLGQFIDSLDKVAALEPSLVLPGHGRPLDKGAERARTIKSHHAQRVRRCADIVVRQGPLPAMEVARSLFDRELIFFEERLALAETLSHLEYLRLRERMDREMIDGVWHYKLDRSPFSGR